MAPNPTKPVCIRVSRPMVCQWRILRLCAARGKAREQSSAALRRAIAGGVDFTLRVEALGVDFIRGEVLPFAVGAGLVELPAFDQFLVVILRVGALLLAGLLDVAVDGFLVAVLLRRPWGTRRRRRAGGPGRRGAGDVGTEQLDDFRVDSVRRPVTVLHLALRVDPFVDDGPGHARPGDQGGEQQKAFHCPILAKKTMHHHYKARDPASPVRIRTACPSSATNILPSPILPVRAVSMMASTTRSTCSSSTASSSFTFGRKSTTYSAPRYSSVWPFCRPKPLTSVTVMPCTPTSAKAARTSSSLNGLMMAMTNFMQANSSIRVKTQSSSGIGAKLLRYSIEYCANLLYKPQGVLRRARD